MRLTASGIILDGKKILLLRRGNDAPSHPSKWCFPGGRGEPGETPEEIVIREVKEEINLDFRPTGIFKIEYADGKKKYRFLGEWSGKVKRQESESSDVGWFTYEQAKNFEFAYNYKEIFEELHIKGYI